MDACCGRLLAGTAHAATAEDLMRSRYTAFAMGDVDHLARTWHPSTRPRRINIDPDRTWTRLEVLGTTGGGMLDKEGTVAFDAHHRDGDGDHVLHEDSAFVRHEGRWVYVGPVTASLS
jgi:SEC-C motif-containing protein